MNYAIITPAKNEEKFIRYTLESVVNQTILPEKWIIVDDGSNDATTNIVEEYIKKFSWIELSKRDTKSEKRSGGSKVIRAFNEGFHKIWELEFDIIVKLDADLTLPPEYFENIINCFLRNPKAGLCGGYCLIEKKGKLVKEYFSETGVRGAFKAYRMECFNEIGGLKEIWSWDGIDELILLVKGWELCVLPLPVIHHRPTSNEYNLVKHSFKSGLEMYRTRTDFISLLYLSLKQLVRKPFVIGGILYILGYCKAFLTCEERVIDKELAKSIRKYRFGKIKKRFKLLRRGK